MGFHDELDTVLAACAQVSRRTGEACTRATTALLDADLELAQQVIAADRHIDLARDDIEERVLELVARHQPVATDLRVVVAALRMATDLERMGDLAAHVAKVARRRYPRSAVPSELAAVVMELGHLNTRMADLAGGVIASRDVRTAQVVEADDDRVDALHRRVLGTILDEGWDADMDVAVDLVLLGRYYERFGDHCTSLVRRMVFVATGEHPARAA